MSARNLTVQALLAGTTVTAVTSTRIYPLPLPLKTLLPAIAVSLAGEDEGYTLAGASQYPLAIVQVHCLAATSTAADNLGEIVKRYMRDLSVEVGPERGAFVKSGPDFMEYDDLQTVHRRMMTFDLRWR